MANYTRKTKTVTAIQYTGNNANDIIEAIGGAIEITVAGIRINKGGGMYIYPAVNSWITKDESNVVESFSNTYFTANYAESLE